MIFKNKTITIARIILKLIESHEILFHSYRSISFVIFYLIL